ncbi:polyadenylation factor subunit 2 [Pancytospora epiphaga]|nr:polyadenylation factor subunit 2 [Pancytospora epiphaga]
MNRRNDRQKREGANARFQNQKQIYDGKRVQPVYERMIYDGTSAMIYEEQVPVLPSILDPRYNLSSQILAIHSPETAPVYDCVTGRFLHLCINKIRSPVNVVLWSIDGRRLLSGSSSGEITMWNGFSFNFDTILQAHDTAIRSMSWSPSGSFLVTGDHSGDIKYWHPSMNNIQLFKAHDEAVKDVSFSNNDSKFCTASDDSTVKIWDSVQSGCERVLKGHNWDVRKAQWHPHYALIASGGKDNLTKLWDPRVPECIKTLHFHKNTITCMRWCDDNFLLTGGRDHIIKKLDLRTMTDSFTYKSTSWDVSALAIHPFSGLFVTGSNDGSILYWDPEVEYPIHESENKHENTIWSLEFHPLGHLLATGSADFLVKFWGRGRPVDHSRSRAISETLVPRSDDDSAIPGL